MLRCVQLFTTPGTVACPAPLPMGFSRQEYWSGKKKKKNTGVGYHSLLQGIFLTQESNWSLMHWQAGSLPPCRLGSICDNLAQTTEDGSERAVQPASTFCQDSAERQPHSVQLTGGGQGGQERSPVIKCELPAGTLGTQESWTMPWEYLEEQYFPARR